MSKRSLILITAAGLMISGCASNGDTDPARDANASRGGVLDIDAPRHSPEPYQPAGDAQTYETITLAPEAPLAAPRQEPQSASPVASAAGRSYTVRAGDTLYGIAAREYGDGKQYTRIVQANPGVDPARLRIGQTLVLP